jgi:hypothetical protein
MMNYAGMNAGWAIFWMVAVAAIIEITIARRIAAGAHQVAKES